MAPKKKREEEFDCMKSAAPQIMPEPDNGMGFNWVEILCYPYILCGKVWQCCVSVCAGTNVCLVCWLLLQWVMCKIASFGTPDPVLFPYYFNIFCQVMLMGLIFLGIWLYFGRTVAVPYLRAIYETYQGLELHNAHVPSRRASFRRYCFKKSEILETTVNNATDVQFSILYLYVIGLALYTFSNNMVRLQHKYNK